MANDELQHAVYDAAECGYDYDFVNPLPDRLLCKICQFTCRKAQLTECCGHVYCQPCLEKMKKVADREYLCPMCRTAAFKTIAHREADRTIKELQIYCPSNKLGRVKCSWTGALADVSLHLKNCQIECRRCSILLGYHPMRRHLAASSCLCKYCHSKKQCYCLVPCTCGQDVLQDKIDEHRKVCPLEVVQCKYQCGAKLTRHEIEKHHKNCINHDQVVDEHFKLLCIENFKNISDEMKNNVSEMKDILEDCNDKIENVFNTLNQSVVDSKQFTEICCERLEKNESALLGNSGLLLIMLVILVVLTVIVIHVQTQLDTIKTSINELSQQPKQKNEAIESVLNDHYKGSSDFEISWLSKQDFANDPKQDHNIILPVIFKMTEYGKKRKNKESWFSDPFFVSKHGCQMCLRVDASGYKDSKDTFVSVFLYLKDLHDITVEHYRHCKWPLKGEFSVELLNQYSDSIHHHQNMKIINNPGISELEFVATNLVFSGLGCYDFISHKILSGSKHIYSGNDTLYFKILYKDRPTNVVHKYHYANMYNYWYSFIAKYLFAPFLALCIVFFIGAFVLNWVHNNEALAGTVILLSFIVIGTFDVGNLLGGILWYVVFILASQFCENYFPDQDQFSVVCILLAFVMVKVLLVDVLHMPWGLLWGIL